MNNSECKNATGIRRGERHPKANLTDHEVELVRKMREQDKMSYGEISLKMETPKTTIIDICLYNTR
jgi:hypothetical protein